MDIEKVIVLLLFNYALVIFGVIIFAKLVKKFFDSSIGEIKKNADEKVDTYKKMYEKILEAKSDFDGFDDDDDDDDDDDGDDDGGRFRPKNRLSKHFRNN